MKRAMLLMALALAGVTAGEAAWWMRSARRDIDGMRSDQDGEYKLAIYTRARWITGA